MPNDDTTTIAAPTLTSESDAAKHATSTENKDESAKHIAALREDANESHVADHIRAMVAATMGNLSTHASDTTRKDAGLWQHWALGVADGLELHVAR